MVERFSLPTRAPAGKRAARPAADRRRRRVGILAPGSSAERAARAVVFWLALAILVLADSVPEDDLVARLAGPAPAVLGVLVGYHWASGVATRTGLVRVWRDHGRPYLSWLVLIGVPTVAWEWSVSPDLGHYRLRSIAWGGAALSTPLSGHWLLAALALASAALRLLERWVPIPTLWLLPAAVAATYAAPLLWNIPAGVGLALVFLSWVLMGQGLRLLRPHVGWRAGLAGLAAGVVLSIGAGGPLDLRHGVVGRPVIGTLGAGLLGAGMIVVAEAVTARAGRRVRRSLAATDRVTLVGLLTFGIGSYLAPESWSVPAVAALAVLGTVLCCGAVGVLPRSAWLTGVDRMGARAGGWLRRRRPPLADTSA